MKQKIFLIQPDKTLTTMEEEPYQSEDLLQQLLESYPSLLAGEQMDEAEPRRWLFISREFGVPDREESGGRWSIDHLFIDQDAIPTLVEVKRSSDTRIRREVVGQMMDYAANACLYWPEERIRAKFEENARSRGNDPIAMVSAILGLDAPDVDRVAQYWATVATNLQAGELRLLFVADEIPVELRRVIEFLDSQMRAQVVGVEVRQFVGEGHSTLVPRVVGQSAASQIQKGHQSERREAPWTVDEALARIAESNHRENTALVRELVEHGRKLGFAVQGGSGTRSATLNFCLRDRNRGEEYKPLQIWDGTNNSTLVIQWRHMGPNFESDTSHEDIRRQILEKTGFELDLARPYPSLPLEEFVDRSKLDGFKDFLTWLAGRMLN